MRLSFYILLLDTLLTQFLLPSSFKLPDSLLLGSITVYYEPFTTTASTTIAPYLTAIAVIVKDLVS